MLGYYAPAARDRIAGGPRLATEITLVQTHVSGLVDRPIGAEAWLAREHKPPVQGGCASKASTVSRVELKCHLYTLPPQGVALGMCSTPRAGVPVSAVALANTCAFGPALAGMHQRFLQFFRRKLYLHHLTAYMDELEIQEASEQLLELAETYKLLDEVHCPEARQ